MNKILEGHLRFAAMNARDEAELKSRVADTLIRYGDGGTSMQSALGFARSLGPPIGGERDAGFELFGMPVKITNSHPHPENDKPILLGDLCEFVSAAEQHDHEHGSSNERPGKSRIAVDRHPEND